MTIAWDAFLSVVIASIVGAAVIVSLFSLGVRFLTDAEIYVSASTGKKAKRSKRAEGKEVAFRTLAYVCFILAAAGALYEIYLIIPYFHLGK